MRNLILFFSLLFVLSCTDDSSSQNASSDAGTQGKSGSLASFTINDYSGTAYLYTVDHEGLLVFSLKDPKDPVQVNRVSVPFDVETLFAYKQYLFVGSQTGMFIYDASSPEEPKKVGMARHFTACDPVVADDTHAYVTLHSNRLCGNNLNQLEIYNIEDIQNPVLISSRGLVQPKGLSLYKDYLFVCDDEVKIFNVKDPKKSELIGTIKKGAFDIIIHQGIIMLIGDDGLYQYKLNDDNITDIQHLSDLKFPS